MGARSLAGEAPRTLHHPEAASDTRARPPTNRGCGGPPGTDFPPSALSDLQKSSVLGCFFAGFLLIFCNFFTNDLP